MKDLELRASIRCRQIWRKLHNTIAALLAVSSERSSEICIKLSLDNE